ncbi:hypothetical protein GCM10027360_65930 [Amycolatopsis echigonensis]
MRGTDSLKGPRRPRPREPGLSAGGEKPRALVRKAHLGTPENQTPRRPAMPLRLGGRHRLRQAGAKAARPSRPGPPPAEAEPLNFTRREKPRARARSRLAA